MAQVVRSSRQRQTRNGPHLGLIRLLLIVGGLVLGLQVVPARAQGPCDSPVVNPIVCENSKPGDPDFEWDISGAGDPSIQGYATDISVNKGQTVQFKIDTTLSSYRLDIYRMGYYNGNGARLITTVNPTAVTNQPNCTTQASTGRLS